MIKPFECRAPLHKRLRYFEFRNSILPKSFFETTKVFLLRSWILVYGIPKNFKAMYNWGRLRRDNVEKNNPELEDNGVMSGNRFFAVTVLNIIITAAEFIGGIFSGSLALISDAFHNLGDSISIVFSYVANKISLRPQNARNTYGYKRADIIAAFLNAIALILICGFLIIEAVKRLSSPSHINGELMLIVAMIGLIANFVSAFLLHGGVKANLNMRATYLHILSDALSSLAIIFGGVLIQLFNWTFIDPVVTILVAIYIGIESWPIIRQTGSILMESAPPINYNEIRRDLEKIDGVVGVHHAHAWLIDEHNVVFSVHVNLEDMMLSDVQPIYSKINKVLKSKYHFCHVTIQAETTRGKGEGIIFNRGKDI